jgi:AraC-like DNA-binding protein
MVTETPAMPEAGAPLQLTLPGLHLDGAIFFRSEFTESWAYESPAVADQLANALRPGAERLLIFHVVARGSCWISLGDGERHLAEAGDVIVIPYGDPHRMGGRDAADVVRFMSLFDPPPWTSLPVLRYGGGGDRTDVVCGYLHSSDPLFDPKLRALPPIFVVRPPDGPARRWVSSSIDYALSLADGEAAPTPTRVPELLLLEILRLHLASAPAAERGWITALRDPALAPALAKLHTEPQRRWTVAELAAEAAVSRSLLDQRFRDVLGLSPIRYLTGWRMHVAADLLSSTDLTVGQIAHRVGYDSEQAFSRAFKRHLTASPSVWRHRRRGVNQTS